MRPAGRSTLALTSVLLLSPLALSTSGCGAGTSTATACTVTPFISPTSVTLDHTVAGNSQQFTTGYKYSGNCAIPAIAVQYQWGVSDTADAAITSPGGVASCTHAALTPITVSSYLSAYGGTPPAPYLAPTNLPSATLTCM
jgi:hypothetical protein